MIFITGGIGSGKHDFVVNSLGFSFEDMSDDPTRDTPVLTDLHEFIRVSGALDDETLEKLAEKQVVICNEVGCGVVPLNAEERQWRDNVGRASSFLARGADTVVRMVCGIPQVIKGELS